MYNCANISKNLVLSQCAAGVAAIEPELILINFDDIDRASSEVNGNVISELVLLDAKKGYKYSSAKNAMEADSPLVKGTYRNAFDHKVVARVFDKTQDIKDELMKLKEGKVVAIVKNVDKRNEATRYEVYGWENGLEMGDLQAPSTDADGVIYNITLQSGDNAKESQLPMSLYAGALTATETMVAGLVAPAA